MSGLISRISFVRMVHEDTRYVVVQNNTIYFVKNKSDSQHKYSETVIIEIYRVLEFLIDNIFV